VLWHTDAVSRAAPAGQRRYRRLL